MEMEMEMETIACEMKLRCGEDADQKRRKTMMRATEMTEGHEK